MHVPHYALQHGKSHKTWFNEKHEAIHIPLEMTGCISYEFGAFTTPGNDLNSSALILVSLVFEASLLHFEACVPRKAKSFFPLWSIKSICRVSHSSFHTFSFSCFGMSSKHLTWTCTVTEAALKVQCKIIQIRRLWTCVSLSRSNNLWFHMVCVFICRENQKRLRHTSSEKTKLKKTSSEEENLL